MSHRKTGDGSQAASPTRPPLVGRLSTSFKETSSGHVGQKTSSKAPKVWEKYTYPWLVWYLILVTVMFIGPWIFLGVVAKRHGLPASPHLTNLVERFAQDVGFFVTLLSSIFAWLVGFLFSKSVTFFAQKWVSTRDTEVSRIHFFANWKNHNPDWAMSRFGILTLIHAGCFLCVTPAFTALLNPVSITRNASLTGTELDFSSTAPACVEWFQNNSIPHTCTWAIFNNFTFTDCLGENQLIDVLESGRSNMLSLIPDNSESLTFTQLGGVRFLGPIQGVLPIGENGIPGFNTIQSSRIDVVNESPISYDYTLGLQGLTTNVSCIYDTTSPITLEPQDNNWSIYNGSCPPGQNVTGIVPYPAPTSPNTLGLWACATSLPDQPYVLYLRGDANYASAIGNMTCAVSPVRPTVFPVTYTSQTGLFTVRNPSLTNLTSPSTLIDRAIFELQNIVAQSQGLMDNLVAESVVTYGVKDFGIPMSEALSQSQKYLRLYESMIEGLLAYEATYIRLIYSSYNSNTTLAPSSCIREVTGSSESKFIGWEATKKTAAYLVGMSIINLTTLTLLLCAMFIGKKLPHFDPTDPVSIIGAGVVLDSSGHPNDNNVLNTVVRYSVAPLPIPALAPLQSEVNEDPEKRGSNTFFGH